MSDRWSQDDTPAAVAGEARARSIDAGLRIYMTKVYNYMAMGLLVTAAAAYFGATSGLYLAIASTPLIYVLAFAPLVMAIWLGSRLHAMSSARAQTMFWVFAGLMGMSLSYVLLVFTGVSVVRTLLVTAGSFGALSLYGYTTKRDLAPMGAFLFMGLIGIILASIVNIFVGSSALHMTVSVLGVLIFAGLTAYDTQDIKRIYYAGDTSEIAEKKAIYGALRLYLDFINLFIMLLQFMGNRE